MLGEISSLELSVNPRVNKVIYFNYALTPTLNFSLPPCEKLRSLGNGCKVFARLATQAVFFSDAWVNVALAIGSFNL